MKKVLLIIFVTIFCSCSTPLPEDLAKNICDCYRDANSNKNSDNKIKAVQRCFDVTQRNLYEMREIEKDQDMSYEQVKKFESRYDQAFNKCK